MGIDDRLCLAFRQFQLTLALVLKLLFLPINIFNNFYITYLYTYCFSISGTDWAGFARTGGVTNAPASFITHHFMITIIGKDILFFAAVEIISFTPPLPGTHREKGRVERRLRFIAILAGSRRGDGDSSSDSKKRRLLYRVVNVITRNYA